MSLLLALPLTLPPQDDTARQARELVEKLSSEEVKEREQAARKLLKLGEAAKGELERALKHRDPEVAARAKELLRPLYAKDAREIFRKIEETVEKAKSVRVRLKYDVNSDEDDPDVNRTARGTFLLKNGNKLFLSIVESWGTKKYELTIKSDGSFLRGQGGSNYAMEPVPLFGRPAPEPMMMSGRPPPNSNKVCPGCCVEPDYRRASQASSSINGGGCPSGIPCRFLTLLWVGEIGD